MSDRKKYVEAVWKRGDTQSERNQQILLDIAWSLHCIARCMIENQGYIDVFGYLIGEGKEES